MDDLLAHVLEAHGGLERWDRATTLTAHLRAGGPFWADRGWPDVLADATVTLDTHDQWISFSPFGGPGLRSTFTTDPERIVIADANGETIEERINPRVSFPSEFDPSRTAWDAVQLAYFISSGIWNYLTAPFVLAHPGVQAKEIDAWHEAGETWRRLAVTFPPSIVNHNADQVFYYDEHFMQRRLDYSPDVVGRAPTAHYTHESKSFDGFIFPTRRIVHLRDDQGIADRSIAFITLDLDGIKATED